MILMIFSGTAAALQAVAEKEQSVKIKWKIKCFSQMKTEDENVELRFGFIQLCFHLK